MEKHDKTYEIVALLLHYMATDVHLETDERRAQNSQEAALPTFGQCKFMEIWKRKRHGKAAFWPFQLLRASTTVMNLSYSIFYNERRQFFMSIHLSALFYFNTTYGFCCLKSLSCLHFFDFPKSSIKNNNSFACRVLIVRNGILTIVFVSKTCHFWTTFTRDCTVFVFAHGVRSWLYPPLFTGNFWTTFLW